MTAFSNNSPNGVHLRQMRRSNFQLISTKWIIPFRSRPVFGCQIFYFGEKEPICLTLVGRDYDDVFGPMEWVHCVLEFDDHPESTQLDSVFVWEQPDLSFKGVLLTSFEDPSFQLNQWRLYRLFKSVNNALTLLSSTYDRVWLGTCNLVWY